MKIAIAGANAGVGRHISEALLEQGKHTIVILSRGNDLPFLSKRGAHIESVSYESQDSLVSALTGVHTVICAIGDHSVSYAAQFALAQAAITAQVTRYIPSGWSATDGGPNDTVELYRFKDPVLELLRGSDIQWSNVVNGIFINYLATPTAGIGYLKPLKFWIDIENCKATIPGDGNMELAYITVEDVATFIVKAVEVEGIWPEQLNIVGSTVTHNELIKLAESVRGRRLFSFNSKSI